MATTFTPDELRQLNRIEQKLDRLLHALKLDGVDDLETTRNVTQLLEIFEKKRKRANNSSKEK
jgi:cell division FtsZ-interacting protein ZapD